MDNNTKIIHEFFYVVGHKDFISHYELVVDRETEKMLYGNICLEGIIECGRFSVKKSNLNKIQEVIDRKYGLVYKVQMDESNYTDALIKAENIIYERLLKVADDFKNYKKEK
jgi:hypothetical protein